MFNSRLDLYGQPWIDTVFSGRNKKYGAYDLRSKESRTTIRAMIIGIVVFALLISFPLILRSIKSALNLHDRTIDQQITFVDLTPPPVDKPKDLPPPPPVEEMKSLTEVKKFTPPVVAPPEQVVEELVKQDDLKDKLAGAKNVDASKDGDIVITEKASTVEQKAVTEDPTKVYGTEFIEVQPSYPGGISKFIQYIVDNLNNIELRDGLTELRMEIKFVIERDGTLTDIQVTRDGGYADIAARAVRVLAKSKPWKPGIMNGRPVRVSYKVPIVVRLAE